MYGLMKVVNRYTKLKYIGNVCRTLVTGQKNSDCLIDGNLSVYLLLNGIGLG